MAELRLLILEDNPLDAELAVAQLEEAGYACRWERVQQRAELVRCLEGGAWDLVVLDYNLPDFDGLRALALVREHNADIPIILVSGTIGEEAAVDSLKAGAADCVLKSNLLRLAPVARRALREHEEHRARLQAEAALRASENRFRALIEHSADAVTLLAADGALIYVSPVGSRLFGRAADDDLGRTIFEFVHPDDRTNVTHAFMQVTEQADVCVTIEARYQHADGSWRWLNVSSKNCLGDPAVRAIVVNYHDITDRKLAEAALQLEAEVSAALARVGRELIASLNTPALLDRLGRVTAAVLDCDFSLTLLWHSKQNVYVPVASYGGTVEQWETLQVMKLPPELFAGVRATLERDELAQVDLALSPHPLVGQLARRFGVATALHMALRCGGEIIGIHIAGYRAPEARFSPRQERIARGVAHLGSLALDHARLVEQLERASRLKSDFLASMSHELRTPLNIIMGYNDLVLEGVAGPLTAEQTDLLQRVDKSAHALLDLINATLDLSRLEAGEVPVLVKECRLGGLVDEIVAEAREQYENPHLDITCQVATDIPLLQTDALKLGVVLKNLISNAVKFTAQGTVTVRARQRDGGVEISVRDTGVGIAPEVLPIIFEPFRQGEGGSTRRYGGIGLGLYIVRRLLDVLGGTVSVDSAVGRGSTFHVWLPTHLRLRDPPPDGGATSPKLNS